LISSSENAQRQAQALRERDGSSTTFYCTQIKLRLGKHRQTLSVCEIQHATVATTRSTHYTCRKNVVHDHSNQAYNIARDAEMNPLLASNLAYEQQFEFLRPPAVDIGEWIHGNTRRNGHSGLIRLGIWTRKQWHLCYITLGLCSVQWPS
ncbi:unnamed protein product, partial [Ectocarpus sp. 12 AP-2014]